MKTRTYKKKCDNCNGTGFVSTWYNPYNEKNISTTSLTNVCPVCNGNQTITVTETEV